MIPVDASLMGTRDTIPTRTARCPSRWALFPNIRQRKDAVNRGKPGRKKAAGLFDQDKYRKRGMIEGVFGAEEAKRHQLHCRFIREDNRLRFAKIGAIAWNIMVINRFECASRLRIPIPTYGGLARAACA